MAAAVLSPYQMCDVKVLSDFDVVGRRWGPSSYRGKAKQAVHCSALSVCAFVPLYYNE